MVQIAEYVRSSTCNTFSLTVLNNVLLYKMYVFSISAACQKTRCESRMFTTWPFHADRHRLKINQKEQRRLIDKSVLCYSMQVFKKRLMRFVNYEYGNVLASFCHSSSSMRILVMWCLLACKTNDDRMNPKIIEPIRRFVPSSLSLFCADRSSS